MSQSQKQALNICYGVFLRNCHDFKAYVTAVMNKWTCLVSQGRVRTAVRRGGHFCCSFVANLLQYPLAKNYRNIMWFDKVIAKIKKVQFFAKQCSKYVNSAPPYYSKNCHKYTIH